MKTYSRLILELETGADSMDNYMEKGHPVPADFSVHNVRKQAPEKIPLHKLRWGRQSAIRKKAHPTTQAKTDPIAVSKNHDGTYTIADGHRTVAAIKRGDTHIIAHVHQGAKKND